MPAIMKGDMRSPRAIRSPGPAGARAALLLLLGALAACEAEPAAPEVEISWRFIDGRPCDLAGVSEVYVSVGPEPPQRFRCADGLLPEGSRELTLAERPVEVTLEGRSVTGGLLYRGRQTAGIETDRLEVTLRFVGGEAPPPP